MSMYPCWTSKYSQFEIHCIQSSNSSIGKSLTFVIVKNTTMWWWMRMWNYVPMIHTVSFCMYCECQCENRWKNILYCFILCDEYGTNQNYKVTLQMAVTMLYSQGWEGVLTWWIQEWCHEHSSLTLAGCLLWPGMTKFNLMRIMLLLFFTEQFV